MQLLKRGALLTFTHELYTLEGVKLTLSDFFDSESSIIFAISFNQCVTCTLYGAISGSNPP